MADPPGFQNIVQQEWVRLREREVEVIEENTRLKAEVIALQDMASRSAQEKEEMQAKMDLQQQEWEAEYKQRSDHLVDKYKVLIGNATETTVKEREDMRSLRQSVYDSEARSLEFAEHLERRARQVIAEYQQRSADLQNQIHQERLLLQEREFQITREADRMKINALNDVNYAIHTAVEQCNQRVAELESGMEKEKSVHRMQVTHQQEKLSQQEQLLRQRVEALHAIHQRIVATGESFHNLSEAQAKVLEMEIAAHCHAEVSSLRERVGDLEAELREAQQEPLRHLAEQEELESTMRAKIHLLLQKNNQNIQEIDEFYTNSQRTHREETMLALQEMEEERKHWLAEATQRFRDMELEWEADKMDLLAQLTELVSGGKVAVDESAFQQRCEQLVATWKGYMRGVPGADPESMAVLLLQADEIQATYMRDLKQLEDIYATREVELRNRYEGRLTQLSQDYRVLQDKLTVIANEKTTNASSAMTKEIGYLNNVINDLTQQLKEGRATQGGDDRNLAAYMEGQVADLSAQLRREKQKAVERELDFNREKASLQANRAEQHPVNPQMVEHYKQLYEVAETRRHDDATAFQLQINQLLAAQQQQETGGGTAEHFRALYEAAQQRMQQDAEAFRMERLQWAQQQYQQQQQQQQQQPSQHPGQHSPTPPVPGNLAEHYRQLYEASENRRAADAAQFEVEKHRMLTSGRPTTEPSADHYQRMYEVSEKRRAEDAAAFEVEKTRLLTTTAAAPASPSTGHYKQLFEKSELRRAEDAATFEIEKARLLVAQASPPRGQTTGSQYRELYELSERRRTEAAANFEVERQRLISAALDAAPMNTGDHHRDTLTLHYKELYETVEQRRAQEAGIFEHEKQTLLSALSRMHEQQDDRKQRNEDEHHQRAEADLRSREEQWQRERAALKEEYESNLEQEREKYRVKEREDRTQRDDAWVRERRELQEEWQKRLDDALGTSRHREHYEELLRQREEEWRKERRDLQDEIQRRLDDAGTTTQERDHYEDVVRQREEEWRRERRQIQEEWQKRLDEERGNTQSILEQGERDRSDFDTKTHQRYQQLLDEREAAYQQHIAELREKLDRVRNVARIEEEERRLQAEDEMTRRMEQERADFEQQLTDRFQKSKQEVVANYKQLIQQLTVQHDARVAELEATLHGQDRRDEEHMIKLMAQMESSRMEYEESVKKRYRELMAQFIKRVADTRENADAEHKLMCAQQEEALEKRRQAMEIERQEDRVRSKKELATEMNRYKEQTMHQNAMHQMEMETRERKYRQDFEQEANKSAEKRVATQRDILENNYRDRCQQLEDKKLELERVDRERQRELEDTKNKIEESTRQRGEQVLQQWKEDIKGDMEALKQGLRVEKEKLEESRLQMQRQSEEQRIRYEQQLRQQMDDEMQRWKATLQKDGNDREATLTKELEQVREQHWRREQELKRTCQAYEDELRAKQTALMADRDAYWEEQERKRKDVDMQKFDQIRRLVMNQEKENDQRLLEYEKAVQDKYDTALQDYQGKTRQYLHQERSRLIEERAELEREKRRQYADNQDEVVEVERACRAKYEEQRKAMIEEHDTKVQEVKAALEREIDAVDAKIVERERDLERKLLNYEEEVRTKYDDRYKVLERALHEEIEAYNARIRQEQEGKVEKEHKMWAMYDMSRMEFEENLRRKYEEALRTREEKYKSQLQHLFAGGL